MRRLNLILASLPALFLGATAYGHVNEVYSCSSCHSTQTGRASVTSSLLTTVATDPGVVANRPKFQVVAGGTIAMPIRILNGDSDYGPVIGGWTSATTDSGVLTSTNTLSFTKDSTWTSRSNGGFFATKGPFVFSAAVTQTYNMAVGATTPADYYLMDFKSSGLDNSGLWTQSLPFYLQVFRDFTYNVNANGVVSNPVNFMPNGIPTGAVGRVIFGTAITSPHTVTIDQNISLLSLAFDNAAASYTLAGPNSISIAGSVATPAVRVLSGSHFISAPLILTSDTRVDIAAGSSLSVGGTLSAAGRNLFKQGSGTLGIPASSLNSITVNGGTLNLSGTGNTIVRAATIDAGAHLDLGAGALIVDYDTGSSPLTVLLASVVDGRLSSSAVTSATRAIGNADTAQFGSLLSYNGTSLDATTLVFVATLKGDTNLDKAVTFDDLLALAQNYDSAGTGKRWTQGDSDYNGSVNFDDLLALAQNYGQAILTDGSMVRDDQLAAHFAADWNLALTMVPEPASLGAWALGALLMYRRR